MEQKVSFFYKDAIIMNINFFILKSFLDYALHKIPLEPRLGLILHGAFAGENSNTTNFLFVEIEMLRPNENDSSITYAEYDKNVYKVPVIENINGIDVAPVIKKSHTFELNHKFHQQIQQNDTILRLRINSNLPVNLPLNIAYDPAPIDKTLGVIYASILLLGLYVIIIWEIIDRTFAAMIASTMSIALLAFMNERPTLPKIVSWIDVETLLLLFGMMILVAILSETGIFDYLAVWAFKVWSV